MCKASDDKKFATIVTNKVLYSSKNKHLNAVNNFFKKICQQSFKCDFLATFLYVCSFYPE